VCGRTRVCGRLLFFLGTARRAYQNPFCSASSRGSPQLASRTHRGGARRAHPRRTMIFATDDIAPVLERTVQWDSLLASRLVTEADVKVIRGYDDQGPLARRAFLEQVRVEPTDDAVSSPTRACRVRTSRC